MPARQMQSRRFAAILAVTGAAGAVLLGWLCVGVNIERACVTADTPYLELCPGRTPGSSAHLAGLRSRIAANPGDANAYVQLALFDSSAARPRLADAAARLAPNDTNVLLIQAAVALDRRDWPTAVRPLVQLTDSRDSPQASLVLARLIAGGQGQLLFDYLVPGSQWLRRALAQLPSLKAPFSTALPLAIRALKAGVLDPNDARGYIRQLKATGAWVDAYSLWLSLHNQALPALYNGSFDQAFDPDGFDWEVAAAMPASRAGAFVDRRSAEKHGAVLDVRFTGRALTIPLVRQYLFLGEGRYRLRGNFMTHQLRTEEGLAWAVRCTAGPAQAGRSNGLRDTGGAWQPFAFEFSIPPGCGLVASLQLETYAPFEAALGARGRAAFDAFTLEKLAP